MAHGNPIDSRIFCRDTEGLKDLMKGGTKRVFFSCIYNK